MSIVKDKKIYNYKDVQTFIDISMDPGNEIFYQKKDSDGDIISVLYMMSSEHKYKELNIIRNIVSPDVICVEFKISNEEIYSYFKNKKTKWVFVYDNDNFIKYSRI